MAFKETSIPQYKQLYELLRKHISENIYPEGSTLPSENELSKTYGLTRPTVRRALDALAKDSYIIKYQGKGSIVHNQPKDIGILSIEGTTSAIGEKRLKTKIIQKPSITSWPDPFLFALSEREKEFGCITMQRLRSVDNNPLFFDTNYIPNVNLPRFTSRNLENKSLFGLLREQYNIEIKGGEQKFKAIPATEETSKHLKINKGAPILHLVRKLYTNKNDFHIYSSLYCNTAEHALQGVF